MDNKVIEALKCIEYQLNNGYIDINDSNGEELEYSIIVVAIRLYKEKYNLA